MQSDAQIGFVSGVSMVIPRDEITPAVVAKAIESLGEIGSLPEVTTRIIEVVEDCLLDTSVHATGMFLSHTQKQQVPGVVAIT